MSKLCVPRLDVHFVGWNDIAGRETIKEPAVTLACSISLHIIFLCVLCYKYVVKTLAANQ